MPRSNLDCRLSAARGDKNDNQRSLRLADLRVARRSGEQWGVLSLDELRECGLSRSAVARRVRNGRLHRLHRGVYAVGHSKPPLQGLFLAAVKTCGASAALSHYSAAALWGLVSWDDRHPEVTVTGTGLPRQNGLRIHRANLLGAQDLTLHEVIRATTPARTLVDLASILPYRPLRRAVRQAQSLGLVNVARLNETLGRSGRRRGVRTLREILAGGPVPTRSELEDVVLDLILRGGLAHPDVNRPLLLDGRRVIPDFRWPEQHLVVEADGAAWHDNQLARADDAERQALLEADGERVLRVTWEQAVARPHETLRRIRQAGAPNEARLRPPT